MMEDSVVSESPETQECDRGSNASEQPEDRSSATEGPDSPDLSPSSSPVPMMLPSDSPDSDFPAPRYSVKWVQSNENDKNFSSLRQLQCNIIYNMIFLVIF